MGWSKVNSKHKKPLKWWYYKFLCELGWVFRGYDCSKFYYNHLGKMCELGFNLYGDKL